MLFNKNERNIIEATESFVKRSNISYLQSDLKDFLADNLSFNIAIVDPFFVKNVDLNDIKVTQPFEKPAVGLSFSFPLENSAMKGMSTSEIKAKLMNLNGLIE